MILCFSSRRRHTRCALVTRSSDVCSSDLARHLVEQDRRGERGVGIGQEGLGRQRAQCLAPVGREVAHRGIEIGAATIPVVHAAAVEPEGKEPRRQVGRRRGSGLAQVARSEESRGGTECVSTCRARVWPYSKTITIIYEVSMKQRWNYS